MREGWKSNPHRRLVRALMVLGKGNWQLVRSSSTSWASATFSGARHDVELQLAGVDAHGAAEALAACLPEAEFTIAGHIVADASVDELRLDRDGGQEMASLRISALTVEDW